jgi:dihydroflavonol-4-reductase/farnesol dehydrogenase
MKEKTKVFVTGATGFIGRKLSYDLACKGFQVNALCRNTDHPYLLKHENIKVFAGDIMNEKSIQKAMAGCKQIYHIAALAKMWSKNSKDFFDINVVGTRNVLTEAARQGIKKIVYTSTCGVLGPTVKYPLTEISPRITGFPIDYERTKYLADLEVKSFVDQGLNIVTVNPSRVFGEGPVTDSNTVSKMVEGYLKGTWRIIPGTGENVANYAFLDDVVAGHISAMELGESGQRYILGGEDISFNQFFETLRSVSGKNTQMVRVPQKLIEFYSRVDWLKSAITGLEPVFLPEFAERLKYDQKYSSKKAIQALNYKITPFRLGLCKTVNYLKTQTL